MVRSEEFHHSQQDEANGRSQLYRRHSDLDAPSGRRNREDSCDDYDGFDESSPFASAARHPSSEWNLSIGAGDPIEASANVGGSNEGTLSSSSSVTVDQGNGLLSPSSNVGGSTVGCGGQLDDKRLRRQIANCNERRRMQSINAGFQALRQLLPCKEGEKMSKAAILQHTADFIHALQQEKNRLAANNEISAQFKRRRLDNPSYNGNDQMDTNEEHNLSPNKDTQPQKTAVLSEMPIDVLKYLKVIEELRQELVYEQQKRKIIEKEIYEIKNKRVNDGNEAGNGTMSPSLGNNEFNADKSCNAYSQMLLSAQSQAPKISPLSQGSAFTAISSLKDALNSPLLSTASPTTSVINSTLKLTADRNEFASAVFAPPQNSGSVEENARAISTITLTLPSDVINRLGHCHPPQSQIVVDVANQVTVGSQQQQQQLIDVRHSQPVSQSLGGSTTILGGGGAIQSRFSPYTNENLLIQVNQNDLLANGKANTIINGMGQFGQQQITPKQTWDPSKFAHQLNGCDSSPIFIVDGALKCEGLAPQIVTSSMESEQLQAAANPNNITPVSTTAVANSAAQNASLSQRNLQAILDAIRHIEGNTIVSISNNTTPSSPRSQASDVLVR